MKKIVSIFLRLIVFLSSFLGVGLCFFSSSLDFMGGSTSLLYFTNQSNIWIGLICLVFVILDIINLIKKTNYSYKWLYIVKYIFTVSITLTGIVFCFVLAPTMKSGAWTLINILTHVIVPVCSIVDLFIDKHPVRYNYKHYLFTIIPPLYYLIFAAICYVKDVKFGYGVNYPYFFLNWDSPAGAFVFSSTMPYFMGTFYWIIVLLIFVVFVAFLYAKLINKKTKSN